MIEPQIMDSSTNVEEHPVASNPSFTSLIPSRYKFDFIENVASRDFIVLLSSRAELHRYISGESHNILYLADPAHLYFLLEVDQLVQALRAAVAQHKFRKILIIGASKSGFSAMLLAALCARRIKRADFRCLAFSGHTRLWPENDALKRFYSYRLFLKKLNTEPGLMEAAQRFGSLKLCQNKPRTFFTLVYGEDHQVDKSEADFLVGSNIRKIPIPFAFHSTMIPFVVRGQRRALRDRLAAVMYETMRADPDMADALPETPLMFARQIDRARWVPPMADLIAGVLDADLKGVPAKRPRRMRLQPVAPVAAEPETSAPQPRVRSFMDRLLPAKPVEQPRSAPAATHSANPEKRLTDSIPNIYHFDYRSAADSDELIVSLQPPGKAGVLPSSALRSRLTLLDTDNLLFLSRLKNLTGALNEIIDGGQFARVLFTGEGACGFSAILLARLCARGRPPNMISALAFSPFTDIRHGNETLARFYSHKRLHDRAALDEPLRATINLVGDLENYLNASKADVTIVFSEGSRVSSAEADRLVGSSVRKIPLPLKFYSPLIACIYKGLARRDRDERFALIFRQYLDDPDLRIGLPPDIPALEEMLQRLTWISSYEQLVEQTFSGSSENDAAVGDLDTTLELLRVSTEDFARIAGVPTEMVTGWRARTEPTPNWATVLTTLIADFPECLSVARTLRVPEHVA